MQWNKHFYLEGRHAFLAPSKPHWHRYDEDQLFRAYKTYGAAQRGTRLHKLAQQLIDERIRMPDDGTTFNMYVNDGIRYQMETEQVLFVSEHCFGTADTIKFLMGMLRIHDLKNGLQPSSFKQLLSYAAMFCIEYEIDPNEIDIELAIYQNDERRVYVPDLGEVAALMRQLLWANNTINTFIEEDLV